MTWVTVHSLVRKRPETVDFMRFWQTEESSWWETFAMPVECRDVEPVRSEGVSEHIAWLVDRGFEHYSTIDLIVPDFAYAKSWLAPALHLARSKMAEYFVDLWENRDQYRRPPLSVIENDLYRIEMALR